MSERNTFVRSLHDLSLAAWFGGSLMGAVGLNGAAARAKDPSERLRLSADGWALWTPVQVAAVAAHTVGGVGLFFGNRKRLKYQPGATGTSVAKLVLTFAAAGVTAYSGYLGSKIKKHQDDSTYGVTEPHPNADPELQSAQKQLKFAQWSIPLLTGVCEVLSSQIGEQQRTAGALDLGPKGVLQEAKKAVGLAAGKKALTSKGGRKALASGAKAATSKPGRKALKAKLS